MSTVTWLIGFGLMMFSFSFLFGRADDNHRPRITVDDWRPHSN